MDGTDVRMRLLPSPASSDPPPPSLALSAPAFLFYFFPPWCLPDSEALAWTVKTRGSREDDMHSHGYQ